LLPYGLLVSFDTGQMNILWKVKSGPKSTSHAISRLLNPASYWPLTPVCLRPKPSAFYAVINLGKLYAAATVTIKSGFD